MMKSEIHAYSVQVEKCIADIERDGFLAPRQTVLFILKVLLFVLIGMRDGR